MILDEHSLCNIIMFTISINQISSKSFLKPMALVKHVFSSDKNIQNLRISSALNDLMKWQVL